MDDLDLGLLHAWNRLTPALRADRALALTRARRRLSPSYTRPIRPWCLALRASDTRLEHLAAIAPIHPDIEGCPQDAPSFIPPDLLHRAQFLILPADSLRALTKPVFLDWPGLDLAHAAQRLGRHPAALATWLRSPHIKLAHYNARSCGKRGQPVPFVWSPTPLDPNANLFEAPDPVWGTLWQSLHTRIPDNTELTLLRIPITRPDPRGSRSADNLRHRGFTFICPGLPNRPCGRTAKKLYLPIPPFTLPIALNHDPLADIAFPFLSPTTARETRCERAAPASATPPTPPPPLNPTTSPPPPSPACEAPCERAAQASATPPTLQPPLDAPTPPLLPPSTPRHPDTSTPLPLLPACHHCHRIRYFSLTDRHGWNTFITHISAGLLYGHEVPRPATIKSKRKRAYKPQRAARPAPTREKVLKLALQGLTPTQIGARLRISTFVAANHINRLFKIHNVHSRAQLAAHFNTPYAKPLPKRLAQLQSLLLRGHSNHRIAHAMNLPIASLYAHLHRLYKLHNVHSRPELLHTLRSQPIPLPTRTRQPRAAA